MVSGEPPSWNSQSAGFAMGAKTCYVYIRGEYVREAERLQHAIDELDNTVRSPEIDLDDFPLRLVEQPGKQ